MKVYNAAGITVGCKPGLSKTWTRRIEEALALQCMGLISDLNLSAEGAKFTPDVLIRDFDEIETKEPEYIVKGSYLVADSAIFDLRKKIGFSFTGDGRLEYWHGNSLELSIPFVVQLLLLQRGRSFIHSAGVSINGKGCIFPAFGGTGKTLIISHLLKQDGVKLLGDDLVAVTETGEAAAYPRPFCLYEYHREAFQDIFEKLGIRHLQPALAWRIYRRLRLESSTRLNLSLPELPNYWGIQGDYVLASPMEIFGPEKIELGLVPIKQIIAVKRNVSLDRIKVIHNVDPLDVARFSASVTAHEWNSYARSLLALGAFNSSRHVDYFLGVHRITEMAFRTSDSHTVVELPEILRTEEYFDTISSLVF
jgi:hypothetical protein